VKVRHRPCHHTGITHRSLYYVDFSDDYTSQVRGGGGIPHPGMLKARDGLKQAHMGKASVYEAELHAQPNDSNL